MVVADEEAESLRQVCERYEATIRIDGLPRTQARLATLELRRMGIAGGRVKGVRRDENDALIRLADAI